MCANIFTPHTCSHLPHLPNPAQDGETKHVLQLSDTHSTLSDIMMEVFACCGGVDIMTEACKRA